MTRFHSRRHWAAVLWLGIAVLACRRYFSPVVLTSSPPPSPTSVELQPVITPVPALLDLQEQMIRIYRQTADGVVAIRSLTTGSLGSGFVVDLDGHLVTNLHVVGEEERLEVDFPSGFKAYGTVLGTDPDLDIAVLTVEAPMEELHPLPLGDSASVQVGQVVLAIGNPFGLNGTLTMGVVSARGRTLASEHLASAGGVFSTGDIIQTDAPINPGNSGGPLLDLNGNVIGVNRAIRTQTFTGAAEPLNSGIGFAVPIDLVKRALPDLIQQGHYDHPYVGIVTVDDLPLPTLEALGLPARGGVYIVQVIEGSPAAQAGLRAGDRSIGSSGLKAGGDLIIAVDDKVVRNFGDLMAYLLNTTRPGDTVTFTVLRDGQEVSIPVTLGSRSQP